VIEGTFATPHSGDLFYRRWDAPERPAAVVLLVHGLAEHSGRYRALAEHLNATGYALCGFDLPGHGLSPGTPGYIGDFAEFPQVVLALRRQLGLWYPDTPVYLLGHSMGGLISTTLLLENQQQFAGAILSGPAILSPLQPGFFQMLVIRLLSLLLPRSGVLQLDAAGVSRDPAVVQDYRDDPLNHTGKISARLVNQLFAAMARVREEAGRITLPMLLLHGGADSMAAAEGSRLLYRQIASQDKTLKIYDGLYHEIFNEPEGPAIFAEVTAWLDRHQGRR
jgi:alpha-beta hydrolase superfamily lysophospholipase